MIKPYLLQIERDDNPLVINDNDEMVKLQNLKWSSILFKHSLYRKRTNAMILSDYPHVQIIHIQSFSFENLSSFVLSNLPELLVLIFEYSVFKNTKSLTLKSCYTFVPLSIDLPKLRNIILGSSAFEEVKSITIKSTFYSFH